MTNNSQFYLAVHTMLMIAGFPQRHITSGAVALSAGCHPVIIRNLFIKLRGAGLLRTKCGRGKTELTRTPQEITLLDILNAVEGGQEMFKIPENHTCATGTQMRALIGGHFARASEAMQAELACVTLASLIAELKDAASPRDAGAQP